MFLLLARCRCWLGKMGNVIEETGAHVVISCRLSRDLAASLSLPFSPRSYLYLWSANVGSLNCMAVAAGGNQNLSLVAHGRGFRLRKAGKEEGTVVIRRDLAQVAKSCGLPDVGEL